jgi:hypothetical protein
VVLSWATRLRPVGWAAKPNVPAVADRRSVELNFLRQSNLLDPSYPISSVSPTQIRRSLTLIRFDPNSFRSLTLFVMTVFVRRLTLIRFWWGYTHHGADGAGEKQDQLECRSHWRWLTFLQRKDH